MMRFMEMSNVGNFYFVLHAHKKTDSKTFIIISIRMFLFMLERINDFPIK